MHNDYIKIRGAREHNLKNLDLDIPKNKLIVITGISGSGKSTLAFDTIYAEGQRRYLESLSSYARQFLGKFNKPDVDSIEGLSPAIAIDQKTTSHNPRSTVGTVTEIYDYLRLLYAKIGMPHCSDCRQVITKTTIDEIVDQILKKPEGTRLEILSPLARMRKGTFEALFEQLQRDGYRQIEIDGKSYSLEASPKLSKFKKHNIILLIDTLELSTENLSRLSQSLELAAQLSGGSIIIRYDRNQLDFNLQLMCLKCGRSSPELEPRSFSFNSPFGACSVCDGLGVHQAIDPELIIPDRNLTIDQGGILPWHYGRNNWSGLMLDSICNYFRIDSKTPIKNLKKDQLELILYGTGKSVYLTSFYYLKGGKKINFSFDFEGIIKLVEERYRDTGSDSIRIDLGKYFNETICPDCEGSRLKLESRLVTICDKNISQIAALSINQALEFFEKVVDYLNSREQIISQRILKEIISRLQFLDQVGLDYLTLNRSANTLAGGEAQRIRLASQLGSKLTGILYVLDEPSIGLHPRDTAKLVDVLKNLRDLGNTVIIVEHDEETIRSADWLVDIGPGAGKTGGSVVISGTQSQIIAADRSITGQYLAGAKNILVPIKRRKAKSFISLYGARANNLKNLNLHLPLGIIAGITGVSGSGKSTLITQTLYNILSRKIHHSTAYPGKHDRIEGWQSLKKVNLINQAPIGRTPRSNLVTYTEIFSPIRQLYAQTKAARIRGYNASRFSFNVAGGRCENCQGEGLTRIAMQFLPDVYLPCDICDGSRYNRETLEVRFKEKNIADILKMTVAEAIVFFADLPLLADKLRLLSDIGLDYLELGQSAPTLSGGEAQRIKLASELINSRLGRSLYILDEPTTGLHIDDIAKLLECLRRLVDRGNSVVIIEHNLDVIKTVDWIIDLGPEGGEKGGRIVASGTPEEVAECEQSYTGRYLKAVLSSNNRLAQSIRLKNQSEKLKVTIQNG